MSHLNFLLLVLMYFFILFLKKFLPTLSYSMLFFQVVIYLCSDLVSILFLKIVLVVTVFFVLFYVVLEGVGPESSMGKFSVLVGFLLKVFLFYIGCVFGFYYFCSVLGIHNTLLISFIFFLFLVFVLIFFIKSFFTFSGFWYDFLFYYFYFSLTIILILGIFFGVHSNGLDDFIVFVVSVCILMLAIVLFVWFVVYLLMFLFTALSYLAGLVCDFCSFVWSYVSKINFSKYYHVFLDKSVIVLEFLGNNLLSFLSSYHQVNVKFVILLINSLHKFAVFLYKFLLGMVVKNCLMCSYSCISYLFVSLYYCLSFLSYLIFSPIIFLLFTLVFSPLSSFFFWFSSSSFYVSTFGVLEGHIYSFWLFHLKHSLSFLYHNCFHSILFLDCHVSFCLVIVNMVSIFIVVVCLLVFMYGFYVTMGTHMDHCVSVIKFHHFSGSFYLLYTILFSYYLVFILGWFVFFLSGVLILFLLVSFCSCLSSLGHSLFNLFLVFLGLFSYVDNFLMVEVDFVTLNSLSVQWDNHKNVLDYHDLFCISVWEVQEGSLDVIEESENPDKFYYKSLFVNVCAVMSGVFVFSIMFTAYVFF